MTVYGTLCFIIKDNKVLGSSLIAQKFTSERYFQSRPSAGDYATIPSGASNLGPTSAAFKEAVDKKRAQLGENAPADLLTTSGSGLDPHLSPEGIRFQIPKLVKARNLDEASSKKLNDLVTTMIEGPQFGFLGNPRVNVLALNLAVDAMFP